MRTGNLFCFFSKKNYLGEIVFWLPRITLLNRYKRTGGLVGGRAGPISRLKPIITKNKTQSAPAPARVGLGRGLGVAPFLGAAKPYVYECFGVAFSAAPKCHKHRSKIFAP